MSASHAPEPQDGRATIRIVVADDHPVVREGLAAMLETQPDFEIVAQAGSGAAALDAVATHDPDVLLLDLQMPEMDGVSVLRQLRDARARTRVIVFTVFDTDERIVAAVQAGAAGYLLKGAPRADLFAAVRVVAAGGSLLAPVAASSVLGRVRHEGPHGAGTDAPDAPPALTPREQAVLEQLARGRGNKQIARSLGITERTVKFHVSAVFTKLGASNRTEAVLRAARAGLITL
ncbi:MAG TPA: response regulator transcription factor [Gemmatimonadaceae bacterium]|nr:response regulator transcription factor [Gemmatimonadaceae bacterium]